MTRGTVNTSVAGVLRCAGAPRPLLVHYAANTFDTTVERCPMTDERLEPVWGVTVYRVALTARTAAIAGQRTLSISAGEQ